jgi:hypothetical protein
MRRKFMLSALALLLSSAAFAQVKPEKTDDKPGKPDKPDDKPPVDLKPPYDPTKEPRKDVVPGTQPLDRNPPSSGGQ